MAKARRAIVTTLSKRLRAEDFLLVPACTHTRETALQALQERASAHAATTVLVGLGGSGVDIHEAVLSHNVSGVPWAPGTRGTVFSTLKSFNVGSMITEAGSVELRETSSSSSSSPPSTSFARPTSTATSLAMLERIIQPERSASSKPLRLVRCLDANKSGTAYVTANGVLCRSVDGDGMTPEGTARHATSAFQHTRAGEVTLFIANLRAVEARVLLLLAKRPESAAPGTLATARLVRPAGAFDVWSHTMLEPGQPLTLKPGDARMLVLNVDAYDWAPFPPPPPSPHSPLPLVVPAAPSPPPAPPPPPMQQTLVTREYFGLASPTSPLLPAPTRLSLPTSKPEQSLGVSAYPPFLLLFAGFVLGGGYVMLSKMRRTDYNIFNKGDRLSEGSLFARRTTSGLSQRLSQSLGRRPKYRKVSVQEVEESEYEDEDHARRRSHGWSTRQLARATQYEQMAEGGDEEMTEVRDEDADDMRSARFSDDDSDEERSTLEEPIPQHRSKHSLEDPVFIHHVEEDAAQKEEMDGEEWRRNEAGAAQLESDEYLQGQDEESEADDEAHEAEEDEESEVELAEEESNDSVAESEEQEGEEEEEGDSHGQESDTDHHHDDEEEDSYLTFISIPISREDGEEPVAEASTEDDSSEVESDDDEAIIQALQGQNIAQVNKSAESMASRSSAPSMLTIGMGLDD